MKRKRFEKVGGLLENFLISQGLYENFKGAEICNKFTFILNKKAPFLIPCIDRVEVDRKTWQLIVYIVKGESSVVVQGFKEIVSRHKILQLLNAELDGVFMVREIIIRK